MDVTAGDVLIQEGDESEDGSFFLILGPPDAQVEVVRQIDGTPSSLSACTCIFITNTPLFLHYKAT